MVKTSVKAHNRKGTKGVKKHSRTKTKKKVVPSKRKSYKVERMKKTEIEDRLLGVYIHTGIPSESVGDAKRIYDELGLPFQYDDKTRIGQISYVGGLDQYYFDHNTKYTDVETNKFIKANLNTKRPQFNRLAQRYVINKQDVSRGFEDMDKLIEEFRYTRGRYGEKEVIEKIKGLL